MDRITRSNALHATPGLRFTTLVKLAGRLGHPVNEDPQKNKANELFHKD